MLGRRQIREKVIQQLYAYQQNPINKGVLVKNMFTDFDRIYDLYVYQLNFLVSLKELAENMIEIGKNKYIKNDENTNPNLKFVKNKVLQLLEDNKERLTHTAKNNNLQWELHNEFLVKTYQKIVAGKRFKDFMSEKEVSFEEDQKFIGKLFLRYMAENEDFHEYLEDRYISWADDFHISNSMVQKTIGFLKENQESHTLIKTMKDDEDREFASKLLEESILHWEESEKKLENKLQNWDLDRISLMDKIIIIAAITELDHFPFTPSRVIINEYIEIAKAFSTPKSQVFVNGILDHYTKEFNRI